jgi:hypothetical protein
MEQLGRYTQELLDVIDRLEARLASVEKNKKELDKCILVCVRCHREIHAGVTLCPSAC